MRKKFYSGKLKTGGRLGDLCVIGKGNMHFYIYVCMYVCIYSLLYSYDIGGSRLENIDW
jgi:hypothetical protein